MKTIIVKFEFPDESLEGYEDCIDEFIIEDHLRECSFDNVGYEILAQPDHLAGDLTYLACKNSKCLFNQQSRCKYYYTCTARLSLPK